MQINWKLTIKVIISLILLVVIFQMTGIQDTFKKLSSANLWYVPVCVAVYVLGQVVSAVRWQKLAEPMGFNLSLGQFFNFYMMGMYLSLFLPGAIGGDVVKMYYLVKNTTLKKRHALLTILAERGFGFMTLIVLIAAFALTPVFSPLNPLFRWVFLAMFGAGFVFLMFLRTCDTQPFFEKVPKLAFFHDAAVYWKDDRLMGFSIGVSLVYHAMLTLIHVLIAHAFGLNVSVPYLIVTYTCVSLVSILPISFNGFGVREGAYQYFLMKAGVSGETGLAFALYFTLVSTLTSMVGGLVMLKGHYKTPKQQELAKMEA